MNELNDWLIVDAHEDIAWNALSFGRNYGQGVQALRRAERHSDVPKHNGLATLGLPEWLSGRVAVIFATLFSAPERHRMGHWDLQTYRDEHEAHRRMQAQLDYYRRFVEDHPQVELIGKRAELEAVLETWTQPDTQARHVGLIPLMEGADAVRTPDEVSEWYAQGVRIIGPAWTGTRYTGGTREPGPLTPLGHALLDAMADTHMILDLSHLAEKAFFEAVERYTGQVIASHSNPRVLAPDTRPDRHLSDEMITHLVQREGVIGIAPINSWLRRDFTRQDLKQKTSITHVVTAIDHVCQLAGNAQHVGIGTDFDGGFGAETIPAELDSIADLPKIGLALAEQGYAHEDVAAIMGGNWLRVLRATLP